MKILQISDLHIGNGWNFISEEKNTDKIVKLVIKKWANDDDKPLVLITGDVTDSGTLKQLKIAKRIFDKLREKGFQLYFIPGNHDYGTKGNINDKKRFKNFKKHLIGIERISYPDVKTIEQKNYNLALIGLNSMKAETGTWDSFLADGELGAGQLQEVEEILDDLEEKEVNESKKYVKIVCIHHHPFILPEDKKDFFNVMFEKWTHYMKDGDELMQLISKDRVDALLFGHDHDHVNFGETQGKETPLTEDYSIPVILSCGKSTAPTKGLFPAWLLEINDDGNVEVIVDSLS